MSVFNRIKTSLSNWFLGPEVKQFGQFEQREDLGDRTESYVVSGHPMNDINRAALMGEISVDKAMELAKKRYQKAFDAVRKAGGNHEVSR